jgi:MFS family permease
MSDSLALPVSAKADPPARESLYDSNFVFGFSANFLFMVGQSLTYHYPLYVKQVGGTEQTVGWVAGIGTAAVLLARPWMGGWVDQLGTTRLWVMGLLLYAAATLANLAVGDVGPLLVLLRVGWNVGWGIVFVCNTAYPAQTAPPLRRAEAIGAQGIGGFVGTVVGTNLADPILALPDEWRFPALFGTAAGFALLAAGSVSMLRPVPASPRHGAAAWNAPLVDIVRYWPGMITLIGLSLGLLFALTVSFIALHAQSIGSPSSSLFLTAYAPAAASVRIFLRRLPEQIGREQTILLGMASAAVGYLSLHLVDGPAMYALPGFLLGLSHGLIFPSMVDLAGESFPPDRRGLSTSLIIGAQEFGMFVGAPIMGLVVHRYGFGPLFSGLAAFAVAAAVLYIVSARRRPSGEPTPSRMVRRSMMP